MIDNKHTNKKTPFFRQCTLRKKVKAGHLETVSWIPEKFAKVGEVVKLRDLNEVYSTTRWIDGWVVELVGARLQEHEIPHYIKSIREHRKKTGDSQPKGR